ncbi:MAG: hypothetical protein ACKPB4_03195 [Sphaerospermopsis kisseleviana]
MSGEHKNINTLTTTQIQPHLLDCHPEHDDATLSAVDNDGNNVDNNDGDGDKDSDEVSDDEDEDTGGGNGD